MQEGSKFRSRLYETNERVEVKERNREPRFRGMKNPYNTYKEWLTQPIIWFNGNNFEELPHGKTKTYLEAQKEGENKK